MKTFPGFPATTRMRYMALPVPFFTTLLPLIDDLAELRVTLHFFFLLSRKRGFPRFVTYKELLADRSLLAGLRDGTTDPQQKLQEALARAEARGTLLRLCVEREGRTEELYFLNSENDRLAVEKIRKGEIAWPDVDVKPILPPTEKPTIYALYEQNIGLITPLIAEELQEAEKNYPVAWIEEAFREAVVRNRRNWRYIARLLERWAAEGKGYGEHRGDTGEDGPPDKYIRGRYGHLVRR